MDKYNTFWRRLGSAIVDGFVLLPLTFIDTYSEATANNVLFYIGLSVSSFIYIAYFVVLHAQYGQTLGKRLMKVQVLRIDEENLLSMKRAIIRELPWVVSTVAILLYLIIENVFLSSNYSIAASKEKYDDLTFSTSFSWMLIELITMFTNYKRRALHDYLAKYVFLKTHT